MLYSSGELYLPVLLFSGVMSISHSPNEIWKSLFCPTRPYLVPLPMLV